MRKFRFQPEDYFIFPTHSNKTSPVTATFGIKTVNEYEFEEKTNYSKINVLG